MDTVFLNLAYLLMVLALVSRDILRLRGFLISSQIAFVTYAVLADNFSMTVWNSVFIAVNATQVVRLMMERRPIRLPAELEDLHRSVFSAMSPREFLYFWETGRIRKITDRTIVRQGEQQTELTMIISGTVSVVQDGTEVARLGRGSFVAEISFLTEEPASADVRAAGEVSCISWNQEKLYSLKQVQPDLLIKLQAILGKDLSRKLKAIASKKVVR